MEMFFIFIVMLAIVGIIAGFVYHPIITILIIGGMIIVIVKIIISDAEKFKKCIPVVPKHSEYIFLRIAKTLEAFACYNPYIDIYSKFIAPHGYKFVIRVEFVNDRFDFDYVWANENVFVGWEEEWFENYAGEKKLRLSWDTGVFTNQSTITVDDVASMAKYMRNELEKKYPEKFFANLYTSYSDGVFGIMANGLFPNDIPTTQKPSASTTTSRIITSHPSPTAPTKPTTPPSTNSTTSDFESRLASLYAELDTAKKKAPTSTGKTVPKAAPTSSSSKPSQRAASTQKTSYTINPRCISKPELTCLYMMAKGCASSTSCKRLYITFERRNNQNGYCYYNGSVSGSPLIGFYTYPSLNEHSFNEFNVSGNMYSLKHRLEEERPSWKVTITTNNKMIVEM